MFFQPTTRDGDQELLQHAEQLLKAVLTKRKIKHDEGTAGRWARQHLRVLCNRQGKERVLKVLDWYCQHIGETFVPQVWNMEAFRVHFLRLEKAMAQAEDAAPPITQETQDLVERLRLNYQFPVEVEARLPVLVQLTHERWQSFWRMVQRSYTTRKAGSFRIRDGEFLQFILNSQSLQFIEDWFAFLARKLHGLQSYTGAPLSLAFRPAHAWFQEHFWWKWSREWCGQARDFDQLLDILIKGEQSWVS